MEEEEEDWASRDERVEVKAKEVEDVISLVFEGLDLLWWGKREAFDAISSTLVSSGRRGE